MERIELARLLGAGGRSTSSGTVTVSESQPDKFMQSLADAAGGGGTVLVADPSWGAVEQAQLAAAKSQTAVQENRIQNSAANSGRGWLCLPTGGSSGALRWAMHDQDTVTAAVRGCSQHFGAGQINAVGVLPLHHVSGLMAWMRCAVTGGRYVPWKWTALEAGRWPEIAGDHWFISLVPTQLQRLLGLPGAADWLGRFRAVLLGGGPAWPDLLDWAAELRVPLAPSYGMTETAAMAAALRPEEFLQGRRGCGTALPHCSLELREDGVIQIRSASLFRGYFPCEREQAGMWSTEDLGRFDEQRGLHVLGRRDAVIISGGEKVDPLEVEVVLRSTGQFVDVVVLGVPDSEWGETVVACYPAGAKKPDLARLHEHVTRELAPHKRPKHYVAVAWPRNAQGKINRARLTALARAACQR